MYGSNNYKESLSRSQSGIPKNVKFGPYISPKLVILQVYFFLYPFGHFGFTALIFLVNLPLTQVMVFFFIAFA